MRFLRTNTAVIITVGPFYDKADGVTIKGSLTISNERITLTADTDDGNAPTNILDNVTGATSGTSNDLNYITGNDAGMMQLELSAANTNRLGRMYLSITDAANHAPVFHEFMVLPAMIYDAFILGTDTLDASMTQILGTAVSTPATAGILDVNVKNIDNDAASASGTVTFPNATLASTTNITAGTVTTATNVTTVNGLANNVITAASIATGAIDADAIADNAIDAGAIAADAITAAKIAADVSAEIADAVWDEDATGHQTGGTFGQAIGDPGADTDTIWALVNTNLNATVSSRATQASVDTIDGIVDDILLDTAEIGAAGAGLTNINLPNQTMDITGNITGNLSGSVGSVTGLTASNLDATISSRASAVDLATVDTVVDAVKAKTDSLTFTEAGKVDSNIKAVNDITVDGAGTTGDPWGPV